MVNITKDDVYKLIELLPEDLQKKFSDYDCSKLIEIVLDVGRIPEARFTKKQVILLSEKNVQQSTIDSIITKIGQFNEDNRAGMEGTLHRISCMRNRLDIPIGLTMRVGRSVFGTIEIIKDCLQSGKSVLMLGPPGVGKTTMLREAAHYLSTEKEQRVVVIDTSNEIAGDGDTPHPAIGRSRRMQVSRTRGQHNVMIEAVENHTPEVIVIDEIGNENEAAAARTIAERGVTLVATAHGMNLENIIQNPTLSDLVGGIQMVTLGDEEAKKRGTRKTILERASRPTFDVCVEIIDRFTVNVHNDVADHVDAILRGWTIHPELRTRNKETDEVTIVEKSKEPQEPSDEEVCEGLPFAKNGESLAIYPYALSKSLLKRAFADVDVECIVANTLDEADMIFALKSYAQPGVEIFKIAENKDIPIKIVNDNSLDSISYVLENVLYEDVPMMDNDWDKLRMNI